MISLISRRLPRKNKEPDSPSDSKKMKFKIKGTNLKDGDGDDQALDEEENGSLWLTEKSKAEIRALMQKLLRRKNNSGIKEKLTDCLKLEVSLGFKM